MQRVFSPHAAAYAVRCKSEQLRDWRRHGFLSGIGERDGKGHLFSVTEVARLAIAVFLFKCGFSLRFAFTVVNERGNQIDAVAMQISAAVPAGRDYYLTFAINPDLGSEPCASITSAPLANVALARDTPGALQINVSEIIRSAVDRTLLFTEHGSPPVDSGAPAVV